MGYDWYKINSTHWIHGSIRQDLTPAQRSVWIDLLCMANDGRVRGRIERSEGIPYDRQWIANYLAIDIELLNSTLEACLIEGRIQDDNGTIVITNWHKYQDVPVSKNRSVSKKDRELQMLALAERKKGKDNE